MKASLATLLVAAWLAAAAPANAQQVQLPQAARSGDATYAEGEVRKVDRSAGKITLKHGEIRNLDMPPMTMVFVVADASMVDQVKVGDRIRFRATSQEGRFTVTEILAAQ
ncbi:copper-binding protein [Ramlibacter sp. Leaf400]|uniref:copper-binding protein n=1 Tax=Ramlibacter sp. Leaf400 TaxID=1736365 RepID=UPI0006F57887|nr:copper-binding protein [Ramlibacter sp. Leaf400]KQT11547.1 hypothetical protein ASG30_06670 [Ramlibacter sp. Leaf400]